MKMMRRMCGLIALAGLAGCNAPTVERGAEVQRFRDTLRQRTEALALKPDAVLTMVQCEEIAVRNNLNLAISRLNLRLQDDQVRIAMAAGLPRAQLQYTDLTQTSKPLVDFGSTEAAMQPQRSETLSVTATIPVLDYGLTYYAYKIATDQRTQQELLLARGTQELRRDVRIAYAKHGGAIRQERLSQTNVAAAEQVLRVGESMEREALATGAETSVLRAALAQTRVDLLIAQRKVIETRLDLARLMSLSPETPVKIDDKLPELPPPPAGEVLARMEEHALLVRPELHVQDLQRHISANTVRAEFSALFPRVDGIGSFNWSNNTFLVNPAYFLYGAQIASALLEGGAQIWRYDLAQQNMGIEEQRTLLITLGVLYDVDLRALQLQRNFETIHAISATEDARRKAFAQILSLYKEGLETEAGTAKALADLNMQSADLDRAQTDYLTTWYEFQAAVLPEEPVPGAATQPATMPSTGATSQPATLPSPGAPTQKASQP